MNSRQSPCVSDACPVCDSTHADLLLEINDMPVHCNLLWSSREQALQAPRGDIRLGFCRACGHIFNTVFDPDVMKYDQEYENSLHFSPRFQEYAKSSATRLIRRYDLYNKDIIEIGCGKGDFLLMLCELGQNRGVGFDPSYVDGRIENARDGQVTVIRDFYSERYADYSADMICCRHVLEHVQCPRHFLNAIRRSIGNRLSTVVFFEVPNVMFTLGHLGIWDLIYEHCGYFTGSSLGRLFNSSGFNVTRLRDGFEGQFLCIDAMPAEDQRDSTARRWNGSEKVAEHVSTFVHRYNNKIDHLRCALERMKHEAQRIVVWGAGSKGVTFLNRLRLQDQIKYVVDINPNKHGMHVPGTGQEIVEPEFLQEYRPDVVIVMNPIYLLEIKNITKEMGLSPNLISV